MTRERKIHVYRGVNIHPDTGSNEMGLRWWAFGAHGTRLRSGTLEGMRELIRHDLDPDVKHYEWAPPVRTQVDVLIGMVNADMFGISAAPGEHVDWSAPDIFTAEKWADLLGQPVEEYAAEHGHMIVFEYTGCTP